MAQLDPRDRLRLGCYYAQQLTLAETGRLLKEHEATTSRQLARTRKDIREAVEQDLRTSWIEQAIRLRDVSSAPWKTQERRISTRCWTYGPDDRKKIATDRSIWRENQ